MQSLKPSNPTKSTVLPNQRNPFKLRLSLAKPSTVERHQDQSQHQQVLDAMQLEQQWQPDRQSMWSQLNLPGRLAISEQMR